MLNVKEIAKRFFPERAHVSVDGKLNVYGDVTLHKMPDLVRNGKIIVPFGEVKDGFFFCNNCGLTSLENCPNVVQKDFRCNNNKLTSLEHAPVRVGNDLRKDNDFWCHDNQLTSLAHCPKIILGNLSCTDNKMRSFVGGPVSVYGVINCDDIQSLEGFPTECKSLFMRNPNVLHVSRINAKVLCRLNFPFSEWAREIPLEYLDFRERPYQHDAEEERRFQMYIVQNFPMLFPRIPDPSRDVIYYLAKEHPSILAGNVDATVMKKLNIGDTFDIL